MSAMAFIDPTFTIAPEYASSYRIVGLPGSDAVPAVPEPASWILMLGGLGAAAAVYRRRGSVSRSPGR